MLLSRRLLAWGVGGAPAHGGEGGGAAAPSTAVARAAAVSPDAAAAPAADRAAAMLAHAEWYERALFNGVLGTQRGVQPGASLCTLRPLTLGTTRGKGRLLPADVAPDPPPHPDAIYLTEHPQVILEAWK